MDNENFFPSLGICVYNCCSSGFVHVKMTVYWIACLGNGRARDSNFIEKVNGGSRIITPLLNLPAFGLSYLLGRGSRGVCLPFGIV